MKRKNGVKLLAVLCVALLVTASFVLFASAETYSGYCGPDGSTNVSWSLDIESGVLTISGAGQMANYYPEVDNRAPWYAYRSQIKSIEISEGITKIGRATFNSLFEITELNLSANVTEFGDFAITGCKKLETITVAEGNENFVSKNNCLIDVKSGELVAACKTSVIPDDGSIDVIGKGAFQNIDISEIIIPDSVRCIEAQAFYGTDIQSLFIPKSVQLINVLIVGGCTSLESITVDSENTDYYSEDNCLVVKASKKLIAGCKTSVIPNDITYIAPYALADCRYEKDVVIPESVGEIGENAFRNATFKKITITNPNVKIDDSAKTIPETATIYGVKGSTAEAYAVLNGRAFVSDNYASGACGAEGSNVRWALDRESGLLTISGEGEMQDFYVNRWGWREYFNEIESVKIENGVTKIGANAFSGLYCLTSVEIADSVTTIGGGSFRDCGRLVDIYIPASVTEIEVSGDGLFSGSNNVKITVAGENTVYYSEENCIIEKETRKIVAACAKSTIPASALAIGESAFAYCDIDTIHIPASVTSISTSAFHGCEMVESVTVDPENYVFFFNGEMLLQGVSNSIIFVLPSLETVTIPNEVVAITPVSFRYCRNLTRVIIDEAHPTYFVDNNCVIRKDTYKLVMSNKDGLIPDYVTFIGEKAFCPFGNITEITVPESVNRIDNYAFYWCDNLTSITIEGFIDYIGAYAFHNNVGKDVEVTFTQQKNPLDRWSINWDKDAVDCGGSITVNWGKTLYVPAGYHECEDGEARSCVWNIKNGVPTKGCEYCDEIENYVLGDTPILSLDFETPIENAVGSDFWVSHKNPSKIYYVGGKDGGKGYTTSSLTFIDDSESHLLFAPEKIHVSVDLMFDLDNVGNSEYESILTFVHGFSGNSIIGSTAYDIVLRYYRGNDGVAKLSYYSDPAKGEYVVIEDEKWYHCDVIGDGEWYYIFVDGKYIGCRTRSDYTLEKFNGGTSLRLADAKATNAVLDNLVITEITPAECPNNSHSYTDDCDRTCNVCGHEREITHSYKWRFNAEYHWKECTLCETQSVKLSHSYSNVFDDKCNDCGYVRIISDADTNTPAVIVESKTAMAGSTVEVAIMLKNIEAVKSILLDEFEYDRNALELVDAEWIVRGAAISDWSLDEEVAVLAFDNNKSVDGAVFVLTFKVKEETEGDFEIACSAVVKKKVASGGEAIVGISVVNGMISVYDIVRGDVNGDGFVDSEDAIHLLRYTLSKDKYPINQDGDMNNDGIVNSDDAIYLLRHALAPDRYPVQ